MPLQIKELHVKVSINSPSDQIVAGGENGQITGGNTNGSNANQEEIIAICIEQILEILKEKMEA